MKPRIYNRNMELLGVLENASKISYSHAYNDLWTASFELPFDDPKTDLCRTHYIVDIFDGDVSKGKYRILDEPDINITSEGQMVKYTCEHVIAFFLNDVIDGYLETGGYYQRTQTVLEQLLAMQSVVRWRLGDCAFDRQFQYSWENTNLLDAIFSVPTCFDESYHWTYDTDSYPWTINLVHEDTTRACEIRRKRNMQFIKREKDSSALVTRLYCKGYGEGVNQLTIKEVNNGLPYIDADELTIDEYGIVCGHFIDHRYTHAETLFARGQALLEELKNPRYIYTAKAIDLSRITGEAWDSYDEGKYVHIIDEEKRIDIDARIISVEKFDVDGNPLDMDVVISNKTSDVASSIEDIAKRASINAQYSQGATNLYAQQYADNADADHPAVMRVYIPSGCVQINQILLAWKLENFRAYETGAASGGSTTVTSEAGGGKTYTSADGGGKTYTSTAGGGTTVTSTAGGGKTYTSTDGGGTTVTSEAGGSTTVTSTAGGGSERTSSSGGGTTSTVKQQVITQNAVTDGMYASSDGADMSNSGLSSSSLSTSEVSGHTHTGPSHAHGLAGHTHYVESHTHSFEGSQYLANGHTHKVTVTALNTATTSTGVSTNSGHDVEISGTTGSGGGKYTNGSSAQSALAGTGNTGSGGSHSHTVDAHSHNIRHFHFVVVNMTIPAQDISIPSHRHTVTIDDHSHDVTLPSHSHDVTLYDHSHDVTLIDHSHDVTLYDHSHDVTLYDHSHNVTIEDHSHKVTIEAHTHGIVYGIYEGGRADSCSLLVDDTPVEIEDDVDEMDIVQYLAKDDNGKITRGVWHEIKIIPSGLSRIEANLFVQTFVTSYTGGNY